MLHAFGNLSQNKSFIHSFIQVNGDYLIFAQLNGNVKDKITLECTSIFFCITN